MAGEKVIVFGPTGNVGSVTAQTAREHGAKVVLGMRDTQKTIPGLSSEEEKSGGYERVQADLTKPDSITAAAQQTGAKRAFIYLARGTQDYMKSTLQALKSAGVDFVVFLSSYSIDTQESRGNIPPSELIPYSHAQVELGLEEVFGPRNYAAVRAGYFATNSLGWKAEIHAGEVKLHQPENKFDFITPTDMGRVCGALLADGQRDGQKIITIFGPELLTQREAVEVIAQSLRKPVKVTEISGEEDVERAIAHGTPPALAKYLTKTRGDLADGHDASDLAVYKTALENVPKYSGRPALTFRVWVEKNKDLFQV